MKNINTDDCWLFGGTISKFGYPITSKYINGRLQGFRVHRIMYENTIGAIPKGLVLDHLCRVRACINPKHLEAVTNQENILRGVGLPARNAKKTHCNYGHEFTTENIRIITDYRTGKPARRCKKCEKHVIRIKAYRRYYIRRGLVPPPRKDGLTLEVRPL